jgi:hypothetical protein
MMLEGLRHPPEPLRYSRTAVRQASVAGSVSPAIVL